MSNSSSVSSSMRTLTVTCRPGGMAGGLCPGSSVLMPSVSGAPRRCTAPEAIGCGGGGPDIQIKEEAPRPAALCSSQLVDGSGPEWWSHPLRQADVIPRPHECFIRAARPAGSRPATAEVSDGCQGEAER
ncbi:hypothetical protein EYF80_035287 [Liparis tanakae]|uniref:Uncharacterized protein n=1 Tax=Liparis tanakae TaxID=230148 RepID=A0A4Z2GPB2_9TELE|nr:hypothetical protein EYF80_035287 [Liparis tanakae]